MGMAFFGTEQPAFANPTRATISLFRALMGDFDFEEMERNGRYEAALYFASFMLVSVLLMLNMLIAVIMDAYNEVKKESLKSVPLWSEIYELGRRTCQNITGHRLRLNHIIKCFAQHMGPDAFESKKLVTLEQLMEAVPELSRTQAMRGLKESVKEWAVMEDKPVELDEILEAVAHLRTFTAKSLGVADCEVEAHCTDQSEHRDLVGVDYAGIFSAQELASNACSTDMLIKALASRIASGAELSYSEQGNLLRSLSSYYAGKQIPGTRPAREQVLHCLFSCSAHLVSQSRHISGPAQDTVLKHLMASANKILSGSDSSALDSAEPVIGI
eukprot:TRINITY_DN51981_c0_g1_i1.p1 TRINITY_DN51981_c0_g1~~TRINITY_DN51981_c0_g1_i1.p1  ORF type:complete len:383 (+),score=51.19 TRINITY_DN51981_c0_g1_i1:165-1151(+)